jgi:hypothetical protein
MRPRWREIRVRWHNHHTPLPRGSVGGYNFAATSRLQEPAMNRFTISALLLSALILPACEGDFVHDPTRPRPTRALGPNYEQNSAIGEMNNGTATGTPILSVELPNKKDESAKVHTIGDSIGKKPAETRPAPGPSIPPDQPAPAIIQQPGARTDPVSGPTR